MSLEPDREPITRPVFVWLEIAARLDVAGAGALAAAIRQAMDRRRLGDLVAFALTPSERERVAAVLQDWHGAQELE